ncbi:MAG: hypothetical protein ACREU7_15790, partial [Burkholderiales bacterium]
MREANREPIDLLLSGDRGEVTMRGYHDIGGLPLGPVEQNQHDYALWEKRVDAMLVLLANKGLISVDEL